MKEIQLTQGKTALVDDDMYEELNQYKWFAQKGKITFYAARMSPSINGNRHVIRMHHEVIGIPPNGFMTDHEDGDGLRNLRSNLRHVTSRQNSQNRKNIKKTSEYPGVCWQKNIKKWIAQLRINGKYKHLGYFIEERKAFEAYINAVNSIRETVIESDNHAIC